MSAAHKERPGGTGGTYELGLETLKQYLAAAVHLQTCQEFLLCGDRVSPPLTAGFCARLTLSYHKKTENERKRKNFVDAAASNVQPSTNLSNTVHDLK